MCAAHPWAAQIIIIIITSIDWIRNNHNNILYGDDHHGDNSNILFNKNLNTLHNNNNIVYSI